MASLVTAGQVKTVLFDIKSVPQDRRPAGLTDGVVDARIRRLSAEVLTRLGEAGPPPPGTMRRDAVDGICLDLVVASLRRDYFGLHPDAVSALNSQEAAAWRRLDALQPSSDFGAGGFTFRVAGARPP